MTARPKLEKAIDTYDGTGRAWTERVVRSIVAAVHEDLAPDLARKAGGLEIEELADRVEALEQQVEAATGTRIADRMCDLGERITALERTCTDPEIGLQGRVRLLALAADRREEDCDRLADEAEDDGERLRQAIKRIEKLEADYGTNGYETEEDQPCGSLGNSGGVASGDIIRSKTICPCGIPTTTAATAGDPSADSPTPEPQAGERFGGLTLAGLTGTWDGLWDLARAYERDHAALRTAKADHQQTKDLLNAEMESRAAYDAEIIAATLVEIDQVRAAAEAALATERQRREDAEARERLHLDEYQRQLAEARRVMQGKEG